MKWWGLAGIVLSGAAVAAVPPEFPKPQPPSGLAHQAAGQLKQCFDPPDTSDTNAVVVACSRLLDAYNPPPAGRSRILTERGLARLGQNNPAAAEADLTESLRLDEQNVRALAAVAYIYALTDRFDQAETMLDALARSAPELALQMIDGSAPRPETGWPTAETLKSLPSGSALAALYHGFAYFNMAKYSQAAVAFRQAIARGDTGAQPYAGLARALWRSGDKAAALDTMSTALKRDPGLISALFDRANMFREANRFAEAVEDFSRILAREKDNVSALDGRGQTYFDLAQYDLALKDLDRAITLKPDMADPWYVRGNVYKNIYKNDKAIADFDMAIKLQPVNSFAHNNRGVVYQRIGQIERALADFNTAIEQDPTNAVAISNRAGVALGRKQFDLAIADFDKALAINPDYVNALRGRAQAFVGAGKPDRALADYNRLVGIDPRPTAWRTQRGEAYMLMGKYDEAIADFTSVVDAKPVISFNRPLSSLMGSGSNAAKIEILAAIAVSQVRTTAYFDRANCYLAQKKLDRAIDDFEQASQAAPDDIPILQGLVSAHIQNHDYPGALAAVEKALKQSPGGSDLLVERAKVRAAMNDFDGALADYNAALYRYPRSVVAMSGRSNLELSHGDYDRAIADADKAAVIDPDNAALHNNACWTRAVAGRELDTALAECHRAIALRAGNASALDSRGLVYFRLGNFAEARKDFEAALAIAPNSASSLFMRGMTKIRLGDAAGGKADLEAAEKLLPGVTAKYARYGVNP